MDPLQLLLGGPSLARAQHISASICAAFKWEGGRKIKKKEMQRAVPPDSSEEFPGTHLGFGLLRTLKLRRRAFMYLCLPSCRFKQKAKEPGGLQSTGRKESDTT